MTEIKQLRKTPRVKGEGRRLKDCFSNVLIPDPAECLSAEPLAQLRKIQTRW